MATNADVISTLEKAKATLQAQCNSANTEQLKKLNTAIHQISDEIGAIEAIALNNATYVPTTNPFKKETDDAKAFLATLNILKAVFGAAAGVASAIDSIIKLVLKLGF